MEEIIISTLFWKQFQIIFITVCLCIAAFLSVWNLPWEEEDFKMMISEMQQSQHNIRMRIHKWTLKTFVGRDKIL